MAGTRFIAEPMELSPTFEGEVIGFSKMSHNRREKNTEPLRVHLGETLKADLKVAAAKAGFETLSPFARKILREWLYGNCGPDRDLLAGSVRDE